MAEAITDGKEQVALRLFIQLADDLAAVTESERRRLVAETPSLTGELHWDAALAGIVAYRTHGEVQPTWIHGRDRYLASPWTFGSGYDIPVDRARVPIQFLERNVLIDWESLVSV